MGLGGARASLGARLWWAGPAAVILAWIVIGASWYLNPWFRFLEHAFSDLGGPEASYPWVYNYGLIATGALVILYSWFIYSVAASKMEAAASALTFVAGIFLALIGVYPSGTRPHTFVSMWFFIQMDMALIALGLGLRVRGSRLWHAITGLSVLAFPIYGMVEATVGWPSVAAGEAYGIIVIDLAVILATIEYRRLARVVA